MIIAVACDDAKFGRQILELLSAQGHRVRAISTLEGAAGFLKRLRESSDLRRLPVLCADPKAGSAQGVVLLDAGAPLLQTVHGIGYRFTPPGVRI